MRRNCFLLDQMLDADVAAAMVEAGYDVVRVSEIGLARAEDDVILERAIESSRVLITLDEHFGDWAVLPLKKHPGVLRIKANPATTTNILSVLMPFLSLHSGSSFCDMLVIISNRGIRYIQTDKL